LAGDGAAPALPAGGQVEAGEVVPAVAARVGKGHENLAAGDRGHAHQRVAEPFLPDRPALGGEDLQLEARGVEGDEAARDGGGGGAVVVGVVLPGEGAGGGVEGVELVAAEAAAEEQPAVSDGGRGERPPAGDGRLPARDAAIRGG